MEKSQFPRHLTAGYWAEVRRILVAKHKLTKTRAKFAVTAYRKCLRQDGVGDIVYHSPVEQTADGIITGEYWRQS